MSHVPRSPLPNLRKADNSAPCGDAAELLLRAKRAVRRKRFSSPRAEFGRRRRLRVRRRRPLAVRRVQIVHIDSAASHKSPLHSSWPAPGRGLASSQTTRHCRRRLTLAPSPPESDTCANLRARPAESDFGRPVSGLNGQLRGARAHQWARGCASATNRDIAPIGQHDALCASTRSGGRPRSHRDPR